MDDKLADILENLGLSEKESKLYLALLELGPTSVQNLSRATGIPRATVYQRLATLNKSKFAVLSEKKGKVVTQAENPNKVLGLLLANLEKRKQAIGYYKQVLPNLFSLYDKKAQSMKITYLHGTEGLAEMLRNELNARKRIIFAYKNIPLPRYPKPLIEKHLEALRRGKFNF